MFNAPILPSAIMQKLKTVIKVGGYLGDNGVWVVGSETTKYFDGAILPLTTKDLQFTETGTYTANNAKLYTYLFLVPGQMIRDRENQLWRIFENKGYAPYASNLLIYVIEKRGESEQ